MFVCMYIAGKWLPLHICMSVCVCEWCSHICGFAYRIFGILDASHLHHLLIHTLSTSHAPAHTYICIYNTSTSSRLAVNSVTIAPSSRYFACLLAIQSLSPSQVVRLRLVKRRVARRCWHAFVIIFGVDTWHSRDVTRRTYICVYVCYTCIYVCMCLFTFIWLCFRRLGSSYRNLLHEFVVDSHSHDASSICYITL